MYGVQMKSKAQLKYEKRIAIRSKRKGVGISIAPKVLKDIADANDFMFSGKGWKPKRR